MLPVAIVLPVPAQVILLLVLSNVFMTFAWYGHLKNMKSQPRIYAALVSWGLALFGYLLQVPANRIGSTTMNLSQQMILQEAITLSVFVPSAIFYMGRPGLMGAVYFIFRP